MRYKLISSGLRVCANDVNAMNYIAMYPYECTCRVDPDSLDAHQISSLTIDVCFSGYLHISLSICLFRGNRKYSTLAFFCKLRNISHRRRISLVNILFTTRRNARIASAVLAIAIPSVCPSVLPSLAGIVSKRRHVALHGAVCTVG